jgi:hypothetical protein
MDWDSLLGTVDQFAAGHLLIAPHPGHFQLE